MALYFTAFERTAEGYSVLCIWEPAEPRWNRTYCNVARRWFRMGDADKITCGRVVDGKFLLSSERVICER